MSILLLILLFIGLTVFLIIAAKILVPTVLSIIDIRTIDGQIDLYRRGTQTSWLGYQPDEIYERAEWVANIPDDADPNFVYPFAESWGYLWIENNIGFWSDTLFITSGAQTYMIERYPEGNYTISYIEQDIYKGTVDLPDLKKNSICIRLGIQTACIADLNGDFALWH